MSDTEEIVQETPVEKPKRVISEKQKLALEKNRSVRKEIYDKKKQDSENLQKILENGYNLEELLQPKQQEPLKKKVSKKKIVKIESSDSEEEVIVVSKKQKKVSFEKQYVNYDW
jgi:hypothetical protein